MLSWDCAQHCVTEGIREQLLCEKGWLVIRGECDSGTIFYTVHKRVSKDGSLNNRDPPYRQYYFVFYMYCLCRRRKSVNSATLSPLHQSNSFSSICSLLSLTFAVLWILLGLSNQENAGSNIASFSHVPYNSVITYHY